MHSQETHEKANDLRKNGHSIKSIARDLNVGVGTISEWVRDIYISSADKKRLYRRCHIAAMSAVRKLREARDEKYKGEAKELWEKFRTQPLFILGIGLYWGEGTKATKILKLSNSDPLLHDVWLRWCKTYIPHVNIRADLIIHDNSNPKLAIKYWKKRLGLCCSISVSIAVSRASQHIKAKKKLPYGTLSISAGKGSAEQHVKMMEWIRLANGVLV
jgi:hypothetical protein